MWQEDLTGRLSEALGHADLVLVPAPAGREEDWAAVLPGSPDGAAHRAAAHQAAAKQIAAKQIADGHLADPEVVARVRSEGSRVQFTLTTAARGQVVADILTGRSPHPGQVAGVHRRAARAAAAMPGAGRGLRPPPDRLYPARLAHARTAMLLRQALAHRVLPADAEPRATVVRTWQDRGSGRTEDGRSRRLLLALAGSNVARTRAAAQGREAPVVANLREVTAAFADWFAHMRATPRGSAPPAPGPIMESYQLNLALALATGSVLAAGLGDLGLTAPEYL